MTEMTTPDPRKCGGMHWYTETPPDGRRMCICGEFEAPPAPLSQPSQQEFEAQLVGAGAAAAAARARMGVSSSSMPPSSRLSELRLTVPPPEAQHAAEAYWTEQREAQLQRDRAGEARRREMRERTVATKLPPNFAWASFEDPMIYRRVQSRSAIDTARVAIDEIRVVLMGPAGVGKTSLAAAMLRARYVLRGGAIAFEPSWELATARSRHALGAGEPDVVRRALDAEIFVLDDLGTEKANPSSAVDDIVFARHWGARATWVTTSKSIEEIKERYGDGIARRVFEGAAIIDCGRGR